MKDIKYCGLASNYNKKDNQPPKRADEKNGRNMKKGWRKGYALFIVKKYLFFQFSVVTCSRVIQ